MTNREAICILNAIYGAMSSEVQIAIDIAIKAIEKEEENDTNN